MKAFWAPTSVLVLILVADCYARAEQEGTVISRARDPDWLSDTMSVGCGLRKHAELDGVLSQKRVYLAAYSAKSLQYVAAIYAMAIFLPFGE